MTQDDKTRPRRRRRQETEGEGGTRGTALVPQRERTVDFYGDDIFPGP